MFDSNSHSNASANAQVNISGVGAAEAAALLHQLKKEAFDSITETTIVKLEGQLNMEIVCFKVEQDIRHACPRTFIGYKLNGKPQICQIDADYSDLQDVTSIIKFVCESATQQFSQNLAECLARSTTEARRYSARV